MRTKGAKDKRTRRQRSDRGQPRPKKPRVQQVLAQVHTVNVQHEEPAATSDMPDLDETAPPAEQFESVSRVNSSN